MSRDVPRRNFWPYDEVTASRDLLSTNRFEISAPWLTFQFDVAEDDLQRAEDITRKLTAKEISGDDLADLNWLFSTLAKYPFSYILPRLNTFGQDRHEVAGTPLTGTTPEAFFSGLLQSLNSSDPVRHLAPASLSSEWTWDAYAALEFSKTEDGYDPETLFSVARRFHLLNDVESNKTAELLQFLSTLEKNSVGFREISALIMRQNHYITEKCESVLSAALPLAQNAKEAVSAFIRAESGHDKILKKALRSLGADAPQVPVLGCVSVLMELFYVIAKRNFLAFSMVVDIFERTSYRREDPFAEALQKGGETLAATQIEAHRDINDAGEHENVAIDFLKHMGPVSKEYAVEALRMSELLTQIVHSISRDTLARTQK